MVEKTIDNTVTEKTNTTTFHVLKPIYGRGLYSSTGFSHDVTVGNESELLSRRLLMMYVVPGTSKGITDEEAPSEAIRRINEMGKSLANKCLSVKFGPWIGPYSKSNPLLTEFPEDMDTMDKCVFYFNRLISPGE